MAKLVLLKYYMNLSDIELSKNDFIASGYETIIDQCEKKECRCYRMPFWQKAEAAKSSNDTKNYAVFTILSAITSLYLNLESNNEPLSNIENIDGISDEHLDILNDFLFTSYLLMVAGFETMLLAYHCS